MNDNQEIEALLLDKVVVIGNNEWTLKGYPNDLIQDLLALKQKWETAARIQSSRDYWLYVHDIVRDRTQRIFDKQEVIDIGSESYALNTGESIQLWFGNQSDKELNNE